MAGGGREEARICGSSDLRGCQPEGACVGIAGDEAGCLDLSDRKCHRLCDLLHTALRVQRQLVYTLSECYTHL